MDLPGVRVSDFSIMLGKQRLVQGEREIGDGCRHDRRSRVGDGSRKLR